MSGQPGRQRRLITRAAVLGLGLCAAMWVARRLWAPRAALWDVRHAAAARRPAWVALALGDAGLPGTVRAWQTAPTMDERRAILDLLNQIGSSRSRDTVVGLATDARHTGTEEAVSMAVGALVEYEGPVTESVLFRIAADATWPQRVRREAAKWLYYRDPPELMDLLSVLAREDDGGLFLEALAERMRLRDDPRLWELLAEYGQHPALPVRERAARLLRDLPPGYGELGRSHGGDEGRAQDDRSGPVHHL